MHGEMPKESMASIINGNAYFKLSQKSATFIHKIVGAFEPKKPQDSHE